jgi:hypothetical protein
VSRAGRVADYLRPSLPDAMTARQESADSKSSVPALTMLNHPARKNVWFALASFGFLFRSISLSFQ